MLQSRDPERRVRLPNPTGCSGCHRAAGRGHRRTSIALGLAAVVSALLAAGCGSGSSATAQRSPATGASPPRSGSSTSPGGSPRSSTTAPPTTAQTTTTAPPPSSTTGAAPTTAAPSTSTSSGGGSSNLPPPGAGFVPGHVTAIGDSVMIDYEGPLQQDVPGISIDASVSRQWGDGEQILQQDKAAGQLGAVVIVGLGTNGPISSSDFDSMMAVLSGASRVIFVNVHVDQPWQDPNNSVLAAGVSRYPNTVLVDWNSLASANPDWFGPDGTHIAIGGTAAQQLAALIASKV